MIGYFEGPLGSGKTTRLLAETNRLLDREPASSILILCSNHSRQSSFIKRLLAERAAPLAQLPVYTYAGFVRNALFDYWPLAEADISAVLKQGSSAIRPELSGMEDSELILRWLLARLRQESAEKNAPMPYEDFPGSDRHILKQIIRRLRLRSENQLSRRDMSERSELLNEMCRPETMWLENQFDRASYRLRTLDANKQLDVFHRLLQQENLLSRHLKASLRHLVVDDVDETIPAQQRFIEWLAPGLETLILAADVDGGSRRGYLNAYPYDWQALKALRPAQTEVLTRCDDVFHAAQALLANWKKTEDFEPLPPVIRVFNAFTTRTEMLDQLVDDILSLLETGAQPGDFCLVLPRTDFLTFHRLESRLNRHGLPVQLLSGTRRPSDNPRCRAFISLLQWANSRRWGVPLSLWELKTLFTQLLKAHQWPEMTEERLDTLLRTIDAHASASDSGSFLPAPDALPVPLIGHALTDYARLSQWLERAAVLPFDKQLYSAFSDLLAVFSDERSAYGDLNRVIQSYLRQREIYRGLTEVQPDEPVTERGGPSAQDGPDGFDRWWLAQVKTGSVADTPDIPEDVRPDSLVIGTPQKIIDTETARKIQIWLDIGSREWARSDNAPLYNAWVHSAVWDGSSAAFSEEFNEAVIRTRAGHITRSLMLLATRQIRAYGSDLDDFGFEQSGLLTPRLLTETAADGETAVNRAILRPDQAPVLAYRTGTMAISAVPGAGKTFVNVELLLELIENGVEADRILVLTYMDSAAKTLLGRLRKKLAGTTLKLPVVSTIHSLALRILTDNDHSILLGALPDDMILLDDYAKGEILARIASATLPESARSVGDWQRAVERGIAHVKMLDLSAQTIRRCWRQRPECFRLGEFVPALEAYEEELRRSGSVDFTDLILKAVRILQEYPDIREKYCRRFLYIIEDEAQDSSRLLQTFIGLLGGESPNLIRTGDTNQSITTTFSSAEPAVFRDFIRQAEHRVHMDHSGRCAPEVIALANFWMEAAGRQPELSQAFEPVKMRAVPGKNPALFEPLQASLFETERLEENWLAERIAAFRQERPTASVAVLVRNNTQVNRVAGQLQAAGIAAVGLNDSINAHPVFRGILLCLKLLAEPGDRGVQAGWRQWMTEAGLLPDEPALADFLDTTPLLYARPTDLAHEALRQWHYDLFEFSRQAVGGHIGALVARMADRLCPDSADRSNGYLCALMATEIVEESRHADQAQADGLRFSPLEAVIQRFDAFQRSWKGRKGFADVLTRQGDQVVQVMTLHKSKGQEFDVVFMPFLQAELFPHEGAAIRVDESDKLVRDLDRVAAREAGRELPVNYTDVKKREKIEEEARLIYVGLTRARCALFLSAHRQTMKFQKARNSQPALAFKLLADYLDGLTGDSQQPAALHVVGEPLEREA